MDGATIAETLARRKRLGMVQRPEQLNLGLVTVYNDALATGFRSSSRCRPGPTERPALSARKLPAVSPNTAAAERVRAKKIAHLAVVIDRQEKERIQAVHKSREIQARREQHRENLFLELLNSVVDDKESVADIEAYLDAKVQAEANKRKQLCKIWNDVVFNVIQSQLDAGLSDERLAIVHEQRDQLHLKYLKASSTNRGVFNDIINKLEYDPLAWEAFDVKYSSKSIDDPLKRDLKRAEEERKFVRSKELMDGRRADKPSTVGRLDVRLWASGKIEGTPYGHFVNMMRASSMNSSSSKVPFDHYTICHDPAVLKAQYFPTGKKIDYARPSVALQLA